MGGGGEAWGEMGGGTREQCGSNKGCTFHLSGSLKNLTTRAWGVGQGGRARGEMGGGAPESSVGATKGALVPYFGLP